MLGTLTHMSQRRATVEARFTCKYCHKVFVQEAKFLAHQCKQMKREEELKTPNGQAAWHYYSLWLRQMKRMPPPAQSFLASKFFRTFNNFVEFSKKVSLPKPEKFIWLMVQKDYPPTMWMSDEVYVMYLEFIDRRLSPIEQAKISVETLFKVADKHEIEINDVFTVLKGHDLLHMLRTRQLSPWLLLNSRAFKKLYVNDLTTEQRILMDQLIRPEYWGDKFEEHMESVVKIRQLTAEMGI